MEGEQDDQGAHVDQFSRDEGGGAEGSYHTIDPLLVEQFPGAPPGELVAYTVGGMFVVAAAPTAVGYVVGGIAWPVLARAGSAVASWLCLDGDCTNEATGATDTVSSSLQRAARFWNRVTNFQGSKAYQRNDLIDPMRTDPTGVTSLERMQAGQAPIGPDGYPLNLHHMLQTQEGPIAEVTQTFHQLYSSIIHINPPSVASGIDRAAFRAWREAYWIQRVNDFLKGVNR
jgi:hypothetical protein